MSDESKSVTKKARGLIGEFKAFISRGNVIDMAVGVIIATAFGKITTSLVNDVVMPAISYFIGSADATSLNITLRPEVVDEAGNVITEGITLGIGTFIGTIIDFLLVALVVFLVIKAMNSAKDKMEAALHKEKEARRTVRSATAKRHTACSKGSPRIILRQFNGHGRRARAKQLRLHRVRALLRRSLRIFSRAQRQRTSSRRPTCSTRHIRCLTRPAC